MDKKDPPKNPPIIKNIGVTDSEKYLGKLCNKTFLSLWSYPGVYQDKGKSGDKGHGKEVCDLLVVFGEHILIFSDKDCSFRKSDDILIDWKRWFKRAIQKSAQQVWGAERWVKQFPSRVYLDHECKTPIPIGFPEIQNAKFHLIVVAHGVSEHIEELYGGSGSLMLDSTIEGFANHQKPFSVGDLDPTKTFVHILDDHSLNILMRTRDTIYDFVSYLEKRELLLRSSKAIFAPGEEELLAIYLKDLNRENEHDFVFDNDDTESPDSILIEEGFWDEFEKNPQRIAQVEEDKISYMWDSLIEKFNHYALEGKQFFVSEGGIKDTEKILRFMASESRFTRRSYSQIMMELLQTTPNDHRRLAVLPPLLTRTHYYVFLLFPTNESISYEAYRSARLKFLQACCMVVKLKYPDAEDIVGIATEVGIDNSRPSEDAVYLDARYWDAKLEEEAKELQEKFEILKAAKYRNSKLREYPEPAIVSLPKNPRNKKCPCGSGKKYKHCHGK
ncbi:MAG: SEC-C metal-binding domain-containing protein [Thermodesulfobacteriota bacterium]